MKKNALSEKYKRPKYSKLFNVVDDYLISFFNSKVHKASKPYKYIYEIIFCFKIF